MELVEQEVLPRPVRPFTLLRRRPGDRLQQLEPLEGDLPLAVAPLQRGVGGVGPAVTLQVQLARPHREVVGRRDHPIGVALHRRVLQLREALAVGQPVHPADHLLGRPAAPVAVAVGLQPRGHLGGLLVLPVALEQLGGRVVGVVGVGGEEVRGDRAAVDADPVEGVVREAVELVPADLLREEGVDARPLEDLRERRRVAEHVRQPQVGLRRAEVLREPAAAQQDLAGQRLAGGDVAVRLHPHRARGLPAALPRLRPGSA